ncbi:6293_t:CDS:2 [Funneliformis caledonium]|uniref:DNA-directed DNA polymerase n=1 Tax=Funneliformis caledonium TaxID=1117310 RepID=A0A9N8WAE0_9GLOM|nr:6293_t:CDS:2 [Funneliformis caledonium]
MEQNIQQQYMDEFNNLEEIIYEYENFIDKLNIGYDNEVVKIRNEYDEKIEQLNERLKLNVKKNDNEDLNNVQNEYEDQINEKNEKIEQFENEVKIHRLELDVKQKEIYKLENQIDKLNIDHNEEVVKIRNEISVLQKENNEEIKQLKDQIDKLLAGEQDDAFSIGKLEKERDGLQKKIENITKEIVLSYVSKFENQSKKDFYLYFYYNHNGFPIKCMGCIKHICLFNHGDYFHVKDCEKGGNCKDKKCLDSHKKCKWGDNCYNNNCNVIVQISLTSSLPKLYTCKRFDRDGNCCKYVKILNKKSGGQTKWFKKGIFLKEGNEYKSVHKKPTINKGKGCCNNIIKKNKRTKKSKRNNCVIKKKKTCKSYCNETPVKNVLIDNWIIDDEDLNDEIRDEIRNLATQPLTVKDTNVNGRYFLEIVGILENSDKIKIVLHDIDVFFDVEINNKDELQDILSLLYVEKHKEFKKIEAWDIETWSGRGLGGLPLGKYKEDEEGSIEPFKKISITIQDNDLEEDWLVYVVKDQKQLILTFGEIIDSIQPDFEIGFNHFHYDWPFLIEKMEEYKIFVKFNEILTEIIAEIDKIKKFSIVNNKNQNQNNSYSGIKINANEYIDYEYFKILGCISLDMRVALKKMMSPKKLEQSSLRFFLEKYHLTEKIDLEHHVLWKYYSDSKNEITNEKESLENMKIILEYCVNDALSCQRLLVKNDLINNYKEISDVAYVSLQDSYMYAINMKVQNLLCAYAFDSNILVSSIKKGKEEEEKFPRAVVFWPIKGLNNKRPITGLDFASLGIDQKKQHVSLLLKNIGEEIMDTCLSVYNEDEPIDVVKKILISKIQNYKNIDKKNFLLSAAWKKDVNNVTVKKFIERLQERGDGDKIVPGERFKYVIVITDEERNTTRKNFCDKISNKMELLDYVIENNLEIDIVYYLDSVVNICARYISYYEQFQPDENHDIWNIEDEDEKMS